MIQASFTCGAYSPCSLKDRECVGDLHFYLDGLGLQSRGRRARGELQAEHSTWNFDQLDSEEDTLWTPEALEEKTDCARRGYLALQVG